MMRATAFAGLVVVIACGRPTATITIEKTKSVGSSPAPKATDPSVASELIKRPIENDAFTVGAVFNGERTMTKGAYQPLMLVVTKRVGADFEGDLTIGDKAKGQPLTIKVTGKAVVGNGTVAFSTEKAGAFQQSFTGDYTDGKLTFECRGVTRNGNPGLGQGVLKREK